MTDEFLDLAGTNPHRSAKPVRQLNATDLGISAPSTQKSKETHIWDELQDAFDTTPSDDIQVAVATADETIVTAIDIQNGTSRPIHAIELGVWKAYSESKSPVTHILVHGDDDYKPCGRCLQTILDYSNDALVRIVNPSEEGYNEFSLDQSSLLDINRDSNEQPDDGQQETDAGTTEDDESDAMSIPEIPPAIDVEVDDDVEVEYIRLNAPVYHLKYRTHDLTFCGTDLTDREFVSSTEVPNLLDPCKSCHGETDRKTVEAQRVQLRSQLSKQVASVSETKEDAATFNEEEISAVLKKLPVEEPTGGTDAVELREQLSQTVVDVHDDLENPLTFSRAEMDALSAALDGEGTISDDPHLFVHTSTGRVARIALSNFNLQHRAGKGELGISLADNEIPTSTFSITPREQLYVFTNLGQVHQVDAHQIPAVARGGEPKPLSNLVKLDENETLQAAISCKDLENHEYVILGTRDGYIKRTSAEDFQNVRRGGIRAIRLEGGDEVRGACLMGDEQEIFMTTKNGRSIRFNRADVRSMGRSARGVRGIELDDGDETVAVNIVDNESRPKVLTVTAEGYGKRTAIDDYRTQSRNGRGLIDIITDERNGPVVAVEMTTEEEKFVAISESGVTIHTAVDEISVLSRNTKGVEIMELNPDDLLSNLTVFEN